MPSNNINPICIVFVKTSGHAKDNQSEAKDLQSTLECLKFFCKACQSNSEHPKPGKDIQSSPSTWEDLKKLVCSGLLWSTLEIFFF